MSNPVCGRDAQEYQQGDGDEAQGFGLLDVTYGVGARRSDQRADERP